MSFPRQVLPGRTYLITRRCTQRQFLLRPDPEMNAAFLYCLAYAATRNDIGIVAFLAEPNHYHAVITDREGRLPLFLESFHKLLAKCGNAIRGRWENFWSSGQTSAVELVEASDVFAKIIYTLTNPVKDHLVERAHHWPGPTSLAANLMGKRFTARRPRHFFRKEGAMPEAVTLECVLPPSVPVHEVADFRDQLSAAIGKAEEAAAAERLRTGTRLLGRKAVLAQDPHNKPKSYEPRRQLNPRVAAKSRWVRVEALLRMKAFRDAYRAAREAWLAGRDVTFPWGTWWLRRFAAVPCQQDACGA